MGQRTMGQGEIGGPVSLGVLAVYGPRKSQGTQGPGVGAC